jgi:hypothetical protein
VRLCKNGLHPMTGYNLKPKGRTGRFQCRECWRISTTRYISSPRGRIVRSEVNARYDYSTKGLLRTLRGRLHEAARPDRAGA